MAKRNKFRVNTKLIAILTASGIAGLGAAYAGWKMNKTKHPERYIAAGDEYAKQHDFQAAADNYYLAASMLPTDSDVHLKLGKAYFQIRSQGSQNFRRCIDELTRAEELDPASKEAWGALLTAIEFEISQIEASPGLVHDREQLPAAISLARDACDHLVKLDPNNLEARIAVSSLKIRVWLLKMAIPPTPAEQRLPADQQKTDDQKVDDAVADLTKLMTQHPENEFIPYWIARAKINQAALLLDVTPNSPDASPLFAEAASEFDNSIGVQPRNINLYLKRAEILDLLQRTDPFAAPVAEYRRQMHQTLDSAQALADISNPDTYQAAKVQWARYLRKQDPARSEETYRDLITRFSALPQYQLKGLQYRIELADMLRQDASRQSDALALLDAIPSIPPSTITDYEQQESWSNWVAYAKLGRAQIETDQLARHPIGKKYDDLVADITASLTAAEGHMQGSVPLLEARGKFQLVTNHLRDAIQTLSLAVDKSTEQNGTVSYDLLRELANALMRGQQPGRAIDLLEGEIRKNPQVANNGEIHGTLANLYLQNSDYVNAKPHVDWLSLRAPDDPGVITLEIQALGPNPDLAVAKPLFDKLPEGTPAQLAIKLNVADGLLNSPEEATRLLKIQHAADPGALEPTRRLIGFDLLAGDKEAARKTLGEMATARPGEPMISVFTKLINGSTPEQLFQEQLDIANKIPDPLLRERRLADIYARVGQSEQELKHLLAAEALSPNDISVLQTVFFLYIDSQRYTDAEAMLPHLSELDADSAHGLMLKAKLCLARKDIQTALVVSRQLTKDFAEFSGSWEIYGEALAASGQAEAACQQFNSAIEKQATNVDARKGLIDCSVQQGKFDDARRYIADARTRFPDDPVYQEMQVNFEIRYGNPESIVVPVTQTLKDHPDVPKNYSIAAQAMMASSRACAARGDSDAATQYLDHAKDVYQQAIKRWPDEMSFTAGLADICMQRNDTAGAEDALKELAARPHWKNQPAPLALLAQAEMRVNKFDVAESLLKQALAQDGNYVQARVLLADCLVAEKQYDEALRTLKPACDGFAVREKYVKLLLQLSRGSEAEDMVSAALKTDPNNPGLINLMIDVYQSEHKAEEALALANQAIASDPQNIGAYLRRGELEASGVNADLDAARKDLTYYCDTIPTDPRAHILLAEVLDATQDREGAVRELKAAISYGNLDRQPRLMLLREYLFSKPPRTADAQQLLTDTLAIPEFQHDALFEMQEAKLWAEQGDSDRAVTAARDAMAHAGETSSLVNDYLSILLLAKKYALLLDESKGYATDPKTSWPVFSYRGDAKALSGDKSGAATEFQTALDRAGAEKGTAAAREVARHIAESLDVNQALDMVAPRAKNSATWSLVSIDLYQVAKKQAAALAAAESAMTSFDSLGTDDQNFLLDRLSSLYIRSKPPQAEKALAIYHKMADRDPNNVDAMNNIASVLSDLTKPPRPQDALVWSKKAYDLCKQNNLMVPPIYDTHGWVLIQCGQLDDGIGVLHEAIDKSDFPDAHYHLAMGYLIEQHPDDAKRELLAARKLIDDPTPSFTVIDPDLKSKIDDALKKADQMIQASTTGIPTTGPVPPPT